MYRVTIEGIADAQLGAVIAMIGTKKYSVKVTHYLHPNQEEIKTASKSTARMSGDTILSLTGKSAHKGSQRDKILKEFEKMEKKHGIGTISRTQLRHRVVDLGFDSTVVGQLLKAGFLKT